MKNITDRGTFARRLVEWYSQNKRDLPWRDTKDPYSIWLSEIILQQTRVSQGLPYYIKFINTFPTVRKLANADLTEVLRIWQGLGYYSRARNLHKCSRIVANELDGVFPNSYAELLKLPGIGPYTASAIASFGFGEQVGVADGNVFRVLSRFLGINDDITSSSGLRKFREVANELAPAEDTAEYNQGIMEFGAIVCKPTPKCQVCLFNQECVARLEGRQSFYPVKLTKVKVSVVHFTYIVFLANNRIWMRRREEGIWNGLFEFVLIQKKISDPEAMVSKICKGKFEIIKSTKIKHLLSHRTIFATFHLVTVASGSTLNIAGTLGRFYSRDQAEALPKPILIDGYFQDTFFSGNFDII